MKRNVEKVEIEQGEDVEVYDFIYVGALVVIEHTLLQKDFIRERGFNKLISPFREVIEKRCWSLLCEHKPVGFVAIVKEFFASLVGKKEKMCYVIGKWISFDRKEINKTYNLKWQKDGSKFKKLLKDPDHQKIVELLTDGKGEWNSTKKNPLQRDH